MNKTIVFTLSMAMGWIFVGCDAEPERSKPQMDAPKTTAPENDSRSSIQGIASSIRWTDWTDRSGIDFVHTYNGFDERYIIETVGGGMASLDYDLDGLIDVYFLNGSTIPQQAGDLSPNKLYRNRGEMRFQDVTAAANCGVEEFGMGVCVADYDNDGFFDIFVNNFGSNRFLRNNGDGTFSETASELGLALEEDLGAGVCFLDANRDGNLDLYIANYVVDPVAKNIKRTTEGFPSYPGPLDFRGGQDRFYLSQGDGTFVDKTKEAGLDGFATTSMGVVAADLDWDGDDDILVVNDVDRNLLFLNDGQGHFEECGVTHGVAFSYDGRMNGNMGIDVGDIDNDGLFDLYSTTFSNEYPVLYRNLGDGMFEDALLATSAGKELFPHANWGVAIFDMENDGDKDIFVANGHTDPMVQSWAYTTAWKVKNSVFENRGKGKFQLLGDEAGSGLQVVESSRGMVAEDFDNDGDLDVILLNSKSKVTVLKNESNIGGWLQLTFRGTNSPRDGTGVRVEFDHENGRFVDEVINSRSYQSSFGNRIHIGLGQEPAVGSLKIHWPSGITESIDQVRANARLFLVEPNRSPSQ
ncbi:MAG: CRTAC1 family protein [Pirellula sp.]|jgi:hypothetical protein|nr:CRTAC1 family protein [Pirellula sp.]